MPDGQLLLVKNNVIINKASPISASELVTVIKQKPNRKIFGRIPFHLFVYNLPNPEKMQKKIDKAVRKSEENNVKKLVKIDSLNVEILRLHEYLKTAEGKDSTKAVKKLNYKEDKRMNLEDQVEDRRKTIREWLRYTVGEEPVILDSSKINSSTKNLHSYLFKKGYFYNEVKDSISIDKKNPKKATVHYIIKLNEPYLIDSINLNISDKKLLRQIEANFKQSLIKTGEPIDYDKLDKERDRITTELRNRGYHFFNKEYIYFDIDTSKGNHKINLELSVSNVLEASSVYADSLVEKNHQRYLIADIFINTDFDPVLVNDYSKNDLYDTLFSPETHEHYIIYNRLNGLRFSPRVILEAIYINKAYMYRQKEVEATFKKLASLGVFRSVNIHFQINPNDPSGSSLNCFINLQPGKRQSIALESNGTNRGGNLGISGNFTYKNKNTFRGAELFRFSMSGGIEAQQVLANEDQSIIGEESGFKPLKTFNTLEFGPELSLHFPKFLVPFNVIKLEKTASPKTVLSATLNYQNRPDFNRVIQDLTFAYEWNGKNQYVSHYLSPTKVSVVKIHKDSSFEAKLNAINDQFLLNSYRDHFILGNQYAFTFNNQDPNHPRRNTVYFKVGLEQSGNSLRKIFEWSGMPKDSVAKIFGIQFAEFLKTNIDFRYNQTFNKSSRMVYRLAGGLGIPQRNFNQALPFEKSFFAGGSNGMRGWKARTLGPGSYRPTSFTFDKIGDIMLEGNLEYRFELFGFFEGALFVDAGNIWNIKPNPDRPGSGFSTQFYTEIAMDAGIGFRFDLGFFIIRLDVAMPIKDPQLENGERWIWEPKPISNQWFNNRDLPNYSARPNLNLGINYPF